MAKKKPARLPKTDTTQALRDMEAKWKRALADYQNLEKRVAGQQQQFVKLATAGFILKLLPVIDHLELAARHLKDQGVTLILGQFHDILSSEGVKPIDALHHPFDPRTMECVDKVPGPENEVVAVTETGYLMGDEVLRPAKVKVGTPESQTAQSNNQQPTNSL